MVSVGATTPQGGTSTRDKNPPQGGAAHGARAHHRGAHNTAGGAQGGTTPRGAPAHRGVPPTRQHIHWPGAWHHRRLRLPCLATGSGKHHGYGRCAFQRRDFSLGCGRWQVTRFAPAIHCHG